MRSTRRIEGVAAASLLLWGLACSLQPEAGPGEITWDRDTCEHCAMVIGERRYAAQIRDAGNGHLHFFDDLGCALLWLTAQAQGGEPASHHSELWVRDAKNEHWIDGFAARYQGGHRTPMGYGFAASTEPEPESFGFEAVGVRLAAQEDRRREGQRWNRDAGK
jgi:copper chaperone NosL